MKRLLMLAGIAALVPAIVLAGGPLRTYAGQAVVYKPAVSGQSLIIKFKIDMGPLGQFADTTGQRLTKESFQAWQDVATAGISFQYDGLLPVDVDEDNYTTYLGVYNDGINPMIFDHNGGIIDTYLGSGASNSVIGFAGSAFFDTGPNAGQYAEGHAVMNGKMAGTNFTYDEFKSTFIHEFGHFIGLDHSQINAQYAANGNSTDDDYLPTMYPTSTDDDTKLATLNPDDILAVSRLYPAGGFPSGTGTIAGSVTRFDGSYVRGANVVAISTADSNYYQVSTVTDYFELFNGSYSISGLAPGDYWIKIEPVRTAFTGGSGVGPYASSTSDISFQNPVRTEYYNGANESDDPQTDDPAARTTLQVTAGNTTTANLVANREAGSSDPSILQYHSASTFLFRLPSQYADVKYAVRFTPTVNGTLTRVVFELGNSQTTGNPAVRGNGTLNVSAFNHTAGSIGGVPSTQFGTTISVPFSGLAAGNNEVDFTSQQLAVTNGVNFHVVFDVTGVAGDTLQFSSDDGATNETDRTSSYYNAGSGLQWYNFKDPSNYNKGYNLSVTAYLLVPTSVDGQEEEVAVTGYMLGQNYPNPFNPATIIPFSLEKAGPVSLSVYDLLGRHVATIIDGRSMDRGAHTAAFDASALESGVYMAVLRAGGTVSTRRMVLVR